MDAVELDIAGYLADAVLGDDGAVVITISGVRFTQRLFDQLLEAEPRLRRLEPIER